MFIVESLAIGTPTIVSLTIEKIYRNENTSEPPSPLSALSPIMRKLGLRILAYHALEIKIWSEVAEKMLQRIYP